MYHIKLTRRLDIAFLTTLLVAKIVQCLVDECGALVEWLLKESKIYCEADGCSARQIMRILWISTFRFCIRKSSSLVSRFQWMQFTTCHFQNIAFWWISG